MRKFKLIKEYPGSPELGFEVFNKKGISYEAKDLTLCGDWILSSRIVENNPEYWEEIFDEIPDYIKCVRSTIHSVAGKVYKVISKYNTTFQWKDDVSYNSVSWPNEYFIPSTKEEFEAQFNKKYEILELKGTYNQRIHKIINGVVFTSNSKGPINSSCWNNDPSIENILKYPNDFTIHSIKRLSDGEIFTVGDKVKQVSWIGPIKEIKIVGPMNNCFVFIDCGDRVLDYLLSVVEKLTPLFKTEDGVDVFEGDLPWFLRVKENAGEREKLWTMGKFEGNIRFRSKSDTYKWFSTKEAAQAYVDKHQEFKIHGYKVEVLPGKFKIGCKEITLTELTHLHKIMIKNNFNKVSFNNYEVCISDIEKMFKM